MRDGLHAFLVNNSSTSFTTATYSLYSSFLQEMRDALHAFLANNTTVKTLDISANPLFNNINGMQGGFRPFHPRWDPPIASHPFISEFQYCVGDEGNSTIAKDAGWYLSDAGLARVFGLMDPLVLMGDLRGACCLGARPAC